MPLVAHVSYVVALLPAERLVAVESDIRRVRRVGGEGGASFLSAEEDNEGGDDQDRDGENGDDNGAGIRACKNKAAGSGGISVGFVLRGVPWKRSVGRGGGRGGAKSRELTARH